MKLKKLNQNKIMTTQLAQLLYYDKNSKSNSWTTQVWILSKNKQSKQKTATPQVKLNWQKARYDKKKRL